MKNQREKIEKKLDQIIDGFHSTLDENGLKNIGVKSFTLSFRENKLTSSDDNCKLVIQLEWDPITKKYKRVLRMVCS